MRNILLTAAAALVACAIGFGAFFLASDVPEMHRAARDNDAMTWLRTEFRLDAAQFAAVKKLHDDYAKTCGEHCAAIQAARERHAPAEELTTLEKTCVDAMTAHFRRVATLMPAGEGDRYLAIVLPRVAGYDHAGAPNLQVQR